MRIPGSLLVGLVLAASIGLSGHADARTRTSTRAPKAKKTIAKDKKEGGKKSAKAVRKLGKDRSVEWSGQRWRIGQSAAPVGPGPNIFSNAPENVWVDSSGALHLKITKTKGHWHCAEVYLDRSLGHGTYTFTLASPVDNLDPQVVLGLFTSQDEAHGIDIEVSRLGRAEDITNMQFAVQPSYMPGNLMRWTMPEGQKVSTHTFRWQAGAILMESKAGDKVLQAWDYKGNSIPSPDDMVPHIKLWLYRGMPPQNNQPVEVVVRDFQFKP
jgi:hypothetical protein